MVVLTRLGPPEHGVRHTQELTSVFINEKPLGRGTLYISEARVSWVGEAGQGFSLEYPHIAMHAVQKDPTVFPHENLYLIIDVRLVDSDGTPSPSSTPTGSDDDDDDDGEDPGMTEIRFVPEDKTKLEAMFSAMSDCQVLHPDPADVSEGDDGEEEEEAEDGEDGGEGDAPQEEGMFDDAEEEGIGKEKQAPTGGEPMDFTPQQ